MKLMRGSINGFVNKFCYYKPKAQKNSFLTLFTYAFGFIMNICWGYELVSLYSENLELR